MATTPLSQAVLAGIDPNVYRPLADIQQGDAMQEIGRDASPTSKWGAIGRLANALAGSYISNSSTSDLAKTIAGGKKSAQQQLLEALGGGGSSIPTAPPQMSPGMRAVPSSSATTALQPDVPTPNQQVANRFPTDMPPAMDAGSPNAQVAARFPAEMSPGSGASPLPNNAPSPLDTAQYPTGPVGGPSEVAASDPAAAIAAATQPRGIRNNNALNIEDGPFAKSQPGYSGSDGRFAKFQTPDHGVAAASALLDTYDQKHGLNTVAGIVNRWAPPSDGNNTMAYASDVAGKLGIDPNAPVPPAMRPALIAAMAQHENGQAAPGTAPVQVASAAPTTANDGDAETPANAAPTSGQRVADAGLDVHKLMAVLQNPYADDTTKQLAQKLLLNQLTPKEDEFASSPQGIYNKRTGELKNGGVAADFGGLQGPELMASLKQSDPVLAGHAQAVIEGREPYPTGSRINPGQQRIKDAVTQIEPNFTAATWLARSQFEKNMASTVPNSFGGQVRSAGTVAKHLGDAHDAIAEIEKGALGASDTLPALNGVKGFLRNQAGDQAYQNAAGHYNTAIKGLADETENLLANGHGAEGSKLYWKDRLDLSKHSPTEVRGALDEFKSLMMGRVSNVAQEKDRVYGKEAGTTDPLSLFGPKERDIMKKIGDDTYKGPVMSDGGPAKPPAAATAAPKTVSTKQDYDALPSGSSYTAPDGSIRTKK